MVKKIKTGQNSYMREINAGMDTVKDRIKKLQGIQLKLLINRGRNRFVSIDGIIKDVYPNVFTVITDEGDVDLYTFSYADVMTKNIKIFRSEKK